MPAASACPAFPRRRRPSLLERDMRLVALTGARYHAATVTCRASLDILRRAKKDGLRVTASTSINHVTLNENDIAGFRTFCKVSPPLRHEETASPWCRQSRRGWSTLSSPTTTRRMWKPSANLRRSADGAIGLETMLAAGLRLVHDGSLDLITLLRATSTHPAEILRLPGGTLAKGSPADIIVFDPDTPFVLDAARLKSRCKNHPSTGEIAGPGVAHHCGRQNGLRNLI